MAGIGSGAYAHEQAIPSIEIDQHPFVLNTANANLKTVSERYQSLCPP